MMSRQAIRLNCPEAYHIAHLYRSGYGCRLIAEMIDRNECWLDKSLRGAKGNRRLAKLVGVLSKGKRKATELKRYEVAR